MQIDKPHTFVNEWNFDKVSFMVDLRIDIKTKETLNITPSQKSCFKPWSHRACDLAATLPRLKKYQPQTGCKGCASARFYKCGDKVAAKSAIGHCIKSVVTSVLSMHKRLAVSDFDRGLVAKVF